MFGKKGRGGGVYISSRNRLVEREELIGCSPAGQALSVGPRSLIV